MPSLLLYSPSPARHKALAEMLALWPSLNLISIDRLGQTLLDAAILDIKDSAPLPELVAAATAHVPRLLITPPPAHHPDSLCTPLYWGPFSARVDQLLRGRDAMEPFDCGPYVCVPLERSLLTQNGDEVARLTDKEMDLLRTLTRAGAAGCTRTELLSQVWGYVEGLDTHTLETHIYRLRQKVEPDPTAPIHLITTDSGYALAIDQGSPSAAPERAP